MRPSLTLRPEVFRNRERLNAQIMPPSNLISGLMKLLMVITTERHGKLVADFQT
jgi:hypothetical protein